MVPLSKLFDQELQSHARVVAEQSERPGTALSFQDLSNQIFSKGIAGHKEKVRINDGYQKQALCIASEVNAIMSDSFLDAFVAQIHAESVAVKYPLSVPDYTKWLLSSWTNV